MLHAKFGEDSAKLVGEEAKKKNLFLKTHSWTLRCLILTAKCCTMCCFYKSFCGGSEFMSTQSGKLPPLRESDPLLAQ